jgi:hypothetical protein
MKPLGDLRNVLRDGPADGAVMGELMSRYDTELVGSPEG